MDTHTKEVFYDKLTFIYLEMPKFNKKEEELDSMFDKWLFVLRNLTRLMEKPATLQERVFTRFFEAAEIAKFTVEEYHHYETSLKVYRDWRNTIDFAVQKATKEGEQKGMQIGMQKGIEKGMQEEKLNIARQMKANGIPTPTIAACTGLDTEEINRL